MHVKSYHHKILFWCSESHSARLISSFAAIPYKGGRLIE